MRSVSHDIEGTMEDRGPVSLSKERKYLHTKFFDSRTVASDLVLSTGLLAISSLISWSNYSSLVLPLEVRRHYHSRTHILQLISAIASSGLDRIEAPLNLPVDKPMDKPKINTNLLARVPRNRILPRFGLRVLQKAAAEIGKL
jgi:hypothetical protein